MATAAGLAHQREFRALCKAAPRLRFEHLAAELPGVTLPTPTSREPRPVRRNWDQEGWIYIARDRSSAIKVGFCGYEPFGRVDAQRLRPVLAIRGCSIRTERAVHQHFAHETVDNEWFVGPDIEAFVERLLRRIAQ